MIIFILVINFLFWNNYRFKRNCKEQCRRRSHIAIAQSPPVVTSCITIRQYQTRKSTMVLSTELISAVLPALSCVCMCECVWQTVIRFPLPLLEFGSLLPVEPWWGLILRHPSSSSPLQIPSVTVWIHKLDEKRKLKNSTHMTLLMHSHKTCSSY